jgi:gliding motility-associated-like protein
MKKILFSIGVYLLFFSVWGQNLTVNNTAPNNSPYWLAENVLVDAQFSIFAPIDPNTGLTIPQPASNQVGRFNAVGTGFPIDSGIVMCAWSIPDVLPNSAGVNPNTGPFTDPELAGVLSAIGSGGYAINDRAQIIFSFVATSDSIEFNYVFGSHEYPIYTCSAFNDVFGFFLTGPNINGNAGVSTVNLATIPNTTVPVAINTINQGSPGSSGVASNCLAANPNYVAHSVYYNASSGAITSLGGYTDKFTARAQVQCGNVYTIRLAIANVSDHILSSAVFLEAKSFSSPSINISNVLNTGNSFVDSTVVEGCSPSYFVFEKDGNINEGMGINLVYSGTAVNGVDLVQLPDSIWIPPGQAFDSIMIEAIDDGIAEGIEDFKMVMQPVTTNCYVYPAQQAIILIRDKTPIAITTQTWPSSDTIFCPGDTASIFAEVTGGEGIIQGWWLDDSTATNRRVIQPSQTTTYYYMGFDECQSDTVIDSLTIYLADYDSVTYNVDSVLVCRGDTAFFNLDVQDGRPPYYIVWPDGTNNPWYFDVPDADTTFYPFTITDACGVTVTDSMMARVAPDPLANFTYLNSLGVPLRVEFSNRSSNAASILWDFGNGNTSTDQEPVYDFPRPGTYPVTLSIVSPDGCVDELTLDVTVETDFYIYVPSAFTPDGDGLNECFEVKGVGFDEYEIKVFDRWGNQVFYSNSIENCWDGSVNGQPAPQGTYSYTIFLRLPFDRIHQKTGVVTVYR